MNNLKVRSLFFMLIATNVFANDSDFYASARAILGDMVEIESTEEKGLATSVSQYAESVLLNNGFVEDDLEVVGPAKDSKGLYAIYRGRSSKDPVIVMAHVDVVPAVKNSWITDPFKMTEIDGFLHCNDLTYGKDAEAELKLSLIHI